MSLPDSDWNVLIEQGRKTQLLGQLVALLQREKLLDNVPAAVLRHLVLVQRNITRRNESSQWEVITLRRVIDPKIPLLLLKGCAYVACADENAAGRVFSDMDILVRRQDLPVVESDMMSVGWMPHRMNDYDLGYYRNWMHEVPPMTHVRRHTVVDLHHAINPPVSRFYIPTDKLFELAQEVSPGVFVLCAVDRIIHCVLHLLQEGESTKLMRDLYDLHLLRRQHLRCATDWAMLRQRAISLNVAPLIESALGAAQIIFSRDSLSDESLGWLPVCLAHAARDAKGDSTLRGQLAGLALLVFSHWLKMPMHLLVPHLMHKSRARMRFRSSLGQEKISTPE